MRRFSFLSWLDDATDGPVGRVVKTVLAAVVLLSLAVAVGRLVREYRAETEYEKAPTVRQGLFYCSGVSSAFPRAGDQTTS